MKKILALILVFVLSLSVFIGCEEVTSADKEQREQTEELMREANNQVGMPNIKYFSEKKMLKEVLEKCDDPELITYIYTVNLNGKLIYQGRGIGFGVPYSVQYTNPDYIARSYSNGGGGVVLPQADPSGLFKPEGLSATWYMMIDEETGETYVEYFEPEIVVKQKKARRELCEEWSLPDNY